MTEQISKQQLMDIKTDIKLLLECMSYQKDTPSAVKQALVTLSSCLQSCYEAKDIFRDTGGLQSVLDTVTSTRYGEVTKAGLYCLGSAVERNVYSQKLLSTASVFTFLHSILSDKGRSVRQKQTAAYLLLCLVSNNGFGQNLARESSCLHDVIALIRVCLPGSETDTDHLEKQEGKSVALWCALVGTACVCVNNPLNEENQRICATLLPYLFNLLQKETSHNITRPALSLVGLTVASNAQNQDRVRKCGGLEIFAQLLKRLISKMDGDLDCKTTAVRLLNTVDSTISDNEENAKLIGKLGALSLILRMLSQESLEDQDKTQIILTLAHAADMYDENKNYIRDSGGITSLIKQLTVTENEELSKTVKYLLQMCVSSGSEVPLNFDENHNVQGVESLVAKMESMKKQNDLQMLEKINKLDEKLRCMEKEATWRPGSTEQLESHDCPAKAAGSCVEVTRSECSFPLSRKESHTDQEAPMTPREKSLLAQLDKEKKEKQRLEALNHMLQENIHLCLTHVASKENLDKCATQEKRQEAPTTPRGDASHHTADPAEVEKSSGYPGGSNTITLKSALEAYGSGKNIENSVSNENSEKQRAYDRLFIQKGANKTSCKQNLQSQEKSVVGDRGNTGYLSGNANNNLEWTDSITYYTQSAAVPLKPLNQACNTNLFREHQGITDFNNNKVLQNQNEVVEEMGNDNDSNTDEIKAGHSSSYATHPTDITDQTNHRTTEECLASNTDRDLQEPNSLPYTKQGEIFITGQQSAPEPTKGLKIIVDKCKLNALNKQNSKTGAAVYFSEGDNKINTGPVSSCVKAKRVLLEYTKAVSKSTCTTPSLSKIATEENEINIPNKSVTHEVAPKILDNLQQTESESVENEKIQLEETEREMKKKQQIDKPEKSVLRPSENTNPATLERKTEVKVGKDTTNTFVMPSAAAPRRKFRRTPQLGSDMLTESTLVNKVKKHQDTDQSDIESVFDLMLLKTANQNKLRQVSENPDANDGCLSLTSAECEHYKKSNITERLKKVNSLVVSSQRRCSDWSVLPVTPTRRQTVPIRPAFSDCGSRRPVFDSPLSVKSVGKIRKRILNDSGIHSPTNTLNISPRSSSSTGSCDSLSKISAYFDDHIDGHSSPENTRITNLKKQILIYKKQEKCPGCEKTMAVDGRFLNSRTYNIALETDPNTCAFHRKLRQLERQHIHQIQKSKKRTGSRLLDILKSKVKRTESRKRSKGSVYNFESDASEQVSPPSLYSEEEEVQHYPARRKRRQRLEYTEDEEHNLLEAVRKMRRSWTQILNTYDFHPSRTAVDLKDKYKSMMKSAENKSVKSSYSSVRSRTRKPFSMCEERRLRRGIKKFGYSWKTILQQYTFSQDRTAEDLRNRWRSMHRRGST